MLLVALGLPGVGPVQRAAGASAEPEVSVQTDDSVPARDVTMIGASPAESPGETWGIGEVGEDNSGVFALVKFTQQEGWARGPELLNSQGDPLVGFQPYQTALMGDMTATGDGVLVGRVGREKMLLVRSPGGAFTQLPISTEGPNALLGMSEEVYLEGRSPLIAPLDEDGHAGALLVPINKDPDANESRVLHWDGEAWDEEPIEVPTSEGEPTAGFRVLAIADSSPSNAWLLAQLSGTGRELALFHRDKGQWREVTPAPLTDEGRPFSVPGAGGVPHTTGQFLTVTSQGVWVDGEQQEHSDPVTMFFKPSGESEGTTSGEVLRAWCNPEEMYEGCNEALPQELPADHLRSFAWANSSSATPFGERVISGLGEGVTLRLEGESFKRVLALGGSAAPNDPGGTFGAAFSSAREGWLGDDEMPDHLTLDPAPDLLEPYPTPFRHTLTAIAPQPGAPVGALTSEALAVGDDGEVARYLPGQGWQPETLFGPGEVHETPRLRAVAWPTPTRAYAVGVLGEMWLWRAETGLWEKDPATPLNFRGNLLGIAFDPAEPSRGYAVGQQGVLLRYGKTWTQEPEANLPPEAQGASFTSIAFAGAEAIVAFRVVHQQVTNAEQHTTEPAHYTGGVLVNDGSGWQPDQQADEALHGEIPWAVGALPDGGAAVSATPGGVPATATIIERNSAGAAWQPAPPYPGTEAPGSLALFRENGALRAIGSGGLPNTSQVEELRPPPAGFPPNLINPYPLASGYVLRQTADGWTDEEHARNPTQDPIGEYKFYDQVYEPDPTAAVLVNESGSEGWAVGGFINTRQPLLNTADVARYPAEPGTTPPGVKSAPVQPIAKQAELNATQATFAIGGDAACEAPCADRARAGIGPDVWLSTALHQAQQVSGLRAFLYTGPRVTSGEGHGGTTVPFAREFARYAELLGSAGALPVYPVPSRTDHPSGGTECEFQNAFAAFAEPLGVGAPEASVRPLRAREVRVERDSEGCATYYAFSSTAAGGTVAVRVIMIDTSASGREWAKERPWLAGELAGAAAVGEPAIVVGNANLNAEIASASTGKQQAEETAQTIIGDHASAYFYDAPEQNIEMPLDNSSIPAFGSGTLGYSSAVNARLQDFLGASGFLLVHVDVAARNAVNVAPVSARLIPNVGEIALEAEGGTLLRRSEVANFAGLARRPRAGGRSQRALNQNESVLYIPIPEDCVGNLCAHRIAPEYSFTSSNPSVGNFVTPNSASPERNAVLLGGPKEEPIPDPESGLFCAFNAGTTEVTISAGGLSFTLPVTVQAGSVRRPCGTVPIKLAPVETPVPTPVSPNPAPNLNTSLPPTTLPPPVPPLPAITAPPALQKSPPVVPPFVVPAALAAPLLPFVPPPVPTPARPTPPSGTSAVTSPVEVAQEEEESEEAPESVSNQAVAYRSAEHEEPPYYLLGLVVLAAFAGASVRRRPRRDRDRVSVATVTGNAREAQRRWGAGRR